MVQREVKNHPRYQEAKEAYENQQAKVMSYLMMNEYLDLMEEINNDLQLLQSIIEQEINSKLD